MKLSSKEKKELRLLQIKLGMTRRQRSAVWQYLLENNLGIGYYYAKKIEERGFRILKRSFFEDQPN